VATAAAFCLHLADSRCPVAHPVACPVVHPLPASTRHIAALPARCPGPSRPGPLWRAASDAAGAVGVSVPTPDDGKVNDAGQADQTNADDSGLPC
jgi:hypothetical protein